MYTLLHYINKMWVPIEEEPAFSDHKSDFVDCFHALYKLIIRLCTPMFTKNM